MEYFSQYERVHEMPLQRFVNEPDANRAAR